MSADADANLAEARRWFLQAEQQFAVAEWNAKGGFWPTACFLFQQSAELALKSLLIRNGERARVHGLSHLVERLASADAAIGKLVDAARSLDRFYMTTRYPDALPTGTSSDYFTEEDAADARSAANMICSEVRNRLSN